MMINVPLPHNVVQLQVEAAEELGESDVHLCPGKTAVSWFRTCSPIESFKGNDSLNSNAASMSAMEGNEVFGIPSIKRSRFKPSFGIKRVWVREDIGIHHQI